jgi:hypothetical protein
MEAHHITNLNLLREVVSPDLAIRDRAARRRRRVTVNLATAKGVMASTTREDTIKVTGSTVADTKAVTDKSQESWLGARGGIVTRR